MTDMTGSGDRLNRIEAILEGLAQNLAQVQAQSQQQFSDANERLTRIEQSIDETRQIADSNAQSITELQQAIDATRKIADSNARSIQALGTTIEDDRAEREQVESELRVDIHQIQETLDRTAGLQQTLFTSQIADREEWHQQRTEINQQIQALIDNQNHDRQEGRRQQEQLNTTVAETQQQIQETQQQIQELTRLSRENTQAHAQFRADIQQISEKLAG